MQRILSSVVAVLATAGLLTAQTVSAATGQPLVGVRISSNQADVGFSATTDAQGNYVLNVRRPGRYVVRASAPGYVMTAYGDDAGLGPLVIATADRNAAGVDFTLQRGGTIAGRVIDDAKEPIVKARVVAYGNRWISGERRFVSVAGFVDETDDRGEFRIIGLAPDEYVVGVQDRALVTFAPATTSLKDARRLTIGIGQEIASLQIQTRAGASGSIKGQVLGGVGLTANSRVSLRSEDGLSAGVWAPLQAGAQYRFDNVAPGRYWLMVQPDAAPVQTRTWSREAVVVAPGQETTQTLTLNEGATITGKASQPGRDISLLPINAQGDPMASDARVRSDSGGAFTLRGVAPGRYRWLRTQEASFHLSIYEGASTTDIADLPFVVAAGDKPRDLRVEVMTGSGATIRGTITDRDGKPTMAGGVIIAGTDPRYWTGVSRRLLVARADQDALYEASRLPAGEYFVAYVAKLAPGQLWDTAFLKKALAGAERVAVKAGDERTLNVRWK